MPKKDMKKYVLKRGKEEKVIHHNYHHPMGGIYFLGFIGAAVYYIQQSTGFWNGVVGVLKALVWPAFLVYKLLHLA
jgi:hypothetical protein